MSHVVPEEVKKDLKKFSEEYNLSMDDVKAMFREEYDKDYLADYDEQNGDRARQAALIVKAELAASGVGNVAVLEGVVFSVSGVLEAEKKKKPGETYKYCDIRGMFSPNPKKEDFTMVRVRVFDGNSGIASVAKNLPRNKPIKLNVSADEYNGRMSYSISNSLHYQQVETGKDGVNLRNFIKNNIKPRNDDDTAFVKIEEIPYKLSEDDEDYKIVEARVKRSNIRQSEKGFTYVSYVLYDDFRGTDEVMYVKVGLTDEIFDTGALVWVIGINKEPDPNYDNDAPSMFAEAVVGVIPKTVSQEKYDAMLSNASKEAESKSAGEKMAEKAKDTDFSGLKKIAKDGGDPSKLTDW